MSTVGDTSALYCLYRGFPVLTYFWRFSQVRLFEHILFDIIGNININSTTAQSLVVNLLGDGYRFRQRREWY